MKFNVYTKQGFPVDPNRLNLVINPANGKIYQNGKNVNDDYIYQPQMDNLTEEQQIRVRISHLENYADFADILIEKMPGLSCSQLKCLIVIMYETMTKRKQYKVIDNQTFLDMCKKGVSRRDAVIEATKSLAAMGHIIRREDEDNIFMYSVKK